LRKEKTKSRSDMEKGDLVLFRNSANTMPSASDNVGLIIEVQARGPVPGAYVLWPDEERAEWIKIESLVKVEAVVSR